MPIIEFKRVPIAVWGGGPESLEEVVDGALLARWNLSHWSAQIHLGTDSNVGIVAVGTHACTIADIISFGVACMCTIRWSLGPF